MSSIRQSCYFKSMFFFSSRRRHTRCALVTEFRRVLFRSKDLVKLCAKHRMPAVAVTDSGNLFGALEFSLAARDAGVQPIIGCQLGIRREDGPGHQGMAPPPDQLVLLAQTEEGRSEEHTSELQSLMRISYAAICL